MNPNLRVDPEGIRELKARNEAGEDIPPFALVKVEGSEADGTYSVYQPDEDNLACWAALDLGIADGEAGSVSRDWPLWVAYTGGTPGAGEEWGAASGSWYLTSGKTGFRIVGDPDTVNEIVQVEPVAAAASGSTGFFARLTDSSGGAWDFVRLKLSAGAYVDDGIETTGYPAVPLTIDGSYLCNPAAGMRVWMLPSQQAGKYEFIPIGYASGTYPGLISLVSQTMGDGPKSFLDQVYVNTTPLAGGVGVDSVRFAVYSNDGSNNTINGLSVSQYGTSGTYVRIGQAFPTYSAITQMVGPVYIGATTGLGGANVDGDLVIYNWGGSYHGLDCQFTYPIGVNGGSASTSFTGGVRLYGQGGATSGWGGGSSYSATVDVYPVYDGAYNLLFLSDAGLYADHHIYCERDIRAGHGSTSGHSYYCDGDQGLTEDVAIPGADGNTYTLHFTGGIYIGYDVDPTGT